MYRIGAQVSHAGMLQIILAVVLVEIASCGVFGRGDVPTGDLGVIANIAREKCQELGAWFIAIPPVLGYKCVSN